MHFNSEKIGFTINNRTENGSTKLSQLQGVINGWCCRTNNDFRSVYDILLYIFKSQEEGKKCIPVLDLKKKKGFPYVI